MRERDRSARVGAGGPPVSRPEVSVVMPFAGDAAAAARRARGAARARTRSGRRADPRRQRRRRRPARTRGSRSCRATARAVAGARAQRRCRARPQRLDPVPRRRLRAPAGPARRVLRRAGRRRRRRAGRRGAAGPGTARRSPRATERRAASCASRRISPTRTCRARSPRTCSCAAPRSSGRRVLRGRPCGRGHRFQLAPAARRAGGSSCGRRRASSTGIARRCASCAASGAATRRGAHGCAAATGVRARAAVLAVWRGRAGRVRRRRRGAAADRRRTDDPAPVQDAEAGRARRGRSTWPSTRCSRSTSWRDSRSRTGPRTRRVGLGARWCWSPTASRPRATRWSSFARTLEPRGSRRAGGRSRSDRGRPRGSRSTTARTTAWQPGSRRSLRLAVRHPVRCARDCPRIVPGRAPADARWRRPCVRLEPRPRAPGSIRSGAKRCRRPRGGSRRSPGGRSRIRDATDARPGRRPVGVHRRLRPRAVRGAGARAGAPGRADHEPLRVRRGAGRRWLRGARDVLPPCSRARRARGVRRADEAASSTSPTCCATGRLAAAAPTSSTSSGSTCSGWTRTCCPAGRPC